MTIQVAAESSFDGDALLRGFEWLGTAVGEQNRLFEKLNATLVENRRRTDEAADAKRAAAATAKAAKEEHNKLLNTVVSLNQGLELAKKAWSMVSGAVTGTIDALRSASEWTTVLDSRFAATADRVNDLERAFALTAEKSGALNGIFDAVQASLTDLATWVSSPAGGEAINSFFQVIAKGAGAAALAMGTLIHYGNQTQDLFAKFSALRSGGMGIGNAAAMALSMKIAEPPDAGASDLETIFFNLFQQLSGAGDAKSGKAPKAQANRAAAAYTNDRSFLDANVSWLTARLSDNQEERQQRAMLLLQADERRSLMEHNRKISDILTADEERRKEHALDVLDTQTSFIRKLVEGQEGGIVAQAENAQKLQDVFDVVAESMANLVVAATESMIAGTSTILGALGNLLAGFVSMLGTMLMRASIGIGIFAALTGDIGEAALAVAAFAAGVGLVALATEVRGGGGGGAGGGGGLTSARGGANPSGGRRYGSERSMPQVGQGGAAGFVSGPQGGSIVNNYALSFDGATIIDPSSAGSAGLGRILRRSLDRADRLGGGRPR